MTRDRSAIDAAFRDPDRSDNLLDLFRAAQDDLLSDKQTKGRVFASSRWKKAKAQLEAETHGKCAFCETPTSAVYYGDVEHFRPKAVYWWLAYCYENFLYSCRVCNGKKSDTHRFAGPPLVAPTVARGLTGAALLRFIQAEVPEPTDVVGVAALTRAFGRERGDLPNPYEIDPRSLLGWEADAMLQEVRIVALDGSADAVRAARAVEEIVDLNRDELAWLRWQTYEPLAQLRELAEDAPSPTREGIVDVIRKLARPEAPFSAMTWHFAHRVWGLI